MFTESSFGRCHLLFTNHLPAVRAQAKLAENHLNGPAIAREEKTRGGLLFHNSQTSGARVRLRHPLPLMYTKSSIRTPPMPG